MSLEGQGEKDTSQNTSMFNMEEARSVLEHSHAQTFPTFSPARGLGSQRMTSRAPHLISIPKRKSGSESSILFPQRWGLQGLLQGLVPWQGLGKACSQLAPARAMRSSKAFSWSLLCNSRTSLMSFSSKPISLNLLIS